ncbi:MAG: hypothetical protein O7A69_07905, partial [SAR324 cluster bacterium]|nr:hypothetical protein [SAR324 cluster bacterium]
PVEKREKGEGRKKRLTPGKNGQEIWPWEAYRPNRLHTFCRNLQADASYTRIKQGSGLVLSIAKAIVEKLGATHGIGFHSEPGEGAASYCDIPTFKISRV